MTEQAKQLFPHDQGDRTRVKDAELQAIERTLRILLPLEADTRQNVIAYLNTRFPVVAKLPPAPVPA